MYSELRIRINKVNNGFSLDISTEGSEDEYTHETYVFTNRYDLLEFLDDTLTLDSMEEEDVFEYDPQFDTLEEVDIVDQEGL